MTIPGQKIRNSARIAMAVESNKALPHQGNRPSEQDLIAWVEGRLDAEQANWVKQWVANDESCYSMLRDHLEYAEYDVTTEPVIRHHLTAPTDAVSQTTGSQPAPRKTAFRNRIYTALRAFFPARSTAVAFATVAVLAILLVNLFPTNAPLGLSDYARMTSDPSANWQQLDAINPSARAARVADARNDKSAFLFGIRSSLQELALTEHEQVRNYFMSLPANYPTCPSDDGLCESTNNWHYKLGRWTVLTERTCNSTLAARDRQALLESQKSALKALSTFVDNNALKVDESLLAAIAVESTEQLCGAAIHAQEWSTS